MKNKKKNKKTQQIIISGIVAIILLILILCGTNSEVLNQVSNLAGLNITFEDNPQEETKTEPKTEYAFEENLKVYFLDVGQADSILVINGTETMLIDGGNNEDGEAVVKFMKEKGITKLNYVVRNPSTRRPYRRLRRCD